MNPVLSLTVLLAISSTLLAEPQRSPCDPPPGSRYDFDLYHKDAETYFAEAEFLLWTVNEGALDYAQKMQQSAWSPTTPSYASGKVQSATFNLDPGVRISAGYFNAPKYWDVRSGYTHFIARGQDGASSPSDPNEFLTGTWPQITDDPLTHAHSKIFFNYNFFDLMISRIFIPNPHFRLRLVGGFGVPWIAQDWKIHYFANSGNTTLRNRWHYVGAGLKTGLMGDWYWGRDVYISCSMFFGSFMGRYSNLSKQTTTFRPSGTEDTYLPVRNSNYVDTRGSFYTQFAFGPSWQKNFGCNRVEVYAGYELTMWSNLQEIHRSSGGTPSEAKETWMGTSLLSLQGLTLRTTVNF